MNQYQETNQKPDFIYFHSKSVGEYKIFVHTHNLYELYLCVSDNINYIINGHHYELHKYDLVMTNKHEAHKPSTRTNGIYERKIIQFRKDFLKDIFIGEDHPMDLFDSRQSGHHNIIKSNDVLQYDLIHYFKEIDRFYGHPYPKSNTIMVKTLLLQLITQLNNIVHEHEHLQQKSLDQENELLWTIQKYIVNHMEQTITLDFLSEKYFINKYYLCHAFKKRFNMTILEYQHLQRLEKAKHLLLEGIPITQICYLVGFNDYSNFYKKFKRIVGLSPKQYVQNHVQIK
ncbi:helix-turn-helix transcriptional regulator [Vallitalea pronyensis]|uniref:Helix-turn-helix transcriptional regulator n=1 Tax=Vallitalea pronyensis TaxID=1348613 RepID=A0A8J8MP74_9FIRM|nr:AraC family transcriptional regulator [Vallitalea pronyensis]QUI25186.1 helix-turn-helix transcriptional regulator [Vallitalea pronyensis]